MTPFFVLIKCKLGCTYDVANGIADAEIASEIYSTSGDFDLLVKFYVDEHNMRLPHSAFRGQTPNEMYFGTGGRIPDELEAAKKVARQSRMKLNRATSCPMCRPSELIAS